jgi:formylglycine-generating enzyme required for sulfatase activity
MRDRWILGAMMSLTGCLGHPQALPSPLELDSSGSSSSGVTSAAETDATQSGETTAASVTTTGPIAECGNFRVEEGEECDGPDGNGTTCESLGLPPGRLSCTSCMLDTAGCVFLGMVLVPGGKFEMGSSEHQDEQPIRQVQVDPFWIDELEVTVADYSECVIEGRCTAPLSAPGCHAVSQESYHPVNCVSWFQAETYCAWADGGTKRLPTEAEWEKAARGTDARTYPWGDAPEPSCRYAVMDDGCGAGTTALAGSRPLGVSPHGAHDMAGNVWEWVADWYALSYDAGDTNNPTGPADGTRRVARGGSWYEADADYFRTSNRLGYEPANDNTAVGFRCARTDSTPP